MASKITPELETKIRELASKGMNAFSIARELKCITNNTIKSWANKNGVILPKRKNKNIELNQKFDLFETLLRSGSTVKEARKKANVGGSSAYKIIQERNLEEFTRTQKEVALDKTLTLEEATQRLPIESGKVIAIERLGDCKRLSYKVEALDGFVYYKYPEALYQGDPRNKMGTPIPLEDIKSELLKIGYEYLDGWINTRASFKAKHTICGYIRDTKLSCYSDSSCPQCNPHSVSKQEIEVRDWVESLGFKTEKYKLPSIKTSCRTLDINVLGKNLAIEFNGLWWHSLERLKESRPDMSDAEISRLHYVKMKMANEQSLRLVTIFSHEWENREFQVKNFLKSTLGIYETKIAGRNTEVKTIDKKIGKEFIENNHIQGAKKTALIYFGLFSENKLVGVLSLGKHHRGGKVGDIVLDRLCFADGILVQGGASKLFKTAIDWTRNQKYSRIVSWSDNRWSEGKVYEKMGFVMEKESKPDFIYYKSGKVYSKQSLKLTKKEKLLKQKEKDLRSEEGYLKVFDCGKKRWVFNLRLVDNMKVL